MIAYAVLILGALASFVCYTRLSALLPMKEEAAVTRTQATVTEVTTPMIKKGEVGSDVMSQVQLRFHAGGQEVEGGYRTIRGEAAPAKGGALEVVYLTKNPRVFLRGTEYADLPRQLTMLRVMMAVFALTAMILPFVILGAAKR